MTKPPLPVVRLKPKTDPRRIRHGFPWIYSNELVTDRRTKALTPGSIARLEDGDRRVVATVTVNPNSKIIARVLDRNTEREIDRGWLRQRLVMALQMRDRLFDKPYYRLIHAEADGLPGVVIDRFGDACVIQPNAAWAEVMFDTLAEALAEVTGVSTIIKNGAGRARVSEGLPNETRIVRGSIDAAVPVPMNGATYMADLITGQKTGLFFDQRPNHAFAQNLAKGGRVLDVFCHVGGFGLAALAGQAKGAVCVDGSAAALTLARQGAEHMGVADRLTTRKGDAFATLEEFAAQGERFDVVICDPPAFAPTKQALEAGLRAYERVAKLAAPLVVPGGFLGLCSCSHAADLYRFRTASVRGIGRAGRGAQLIHSGYAGPDHPQHPMLAESGYLKALFFRLVD